MNGWMGNLLRVNLTDGSYAIESSEKYFAYIGGKGMANRIIYDEVPAGTDPVAPENKIVFAVGRPFPPFPPSPSTTRSSTRTWAATPPWR